MTKSLTVNQLFESHADKLALEWLAGQAGAWCDIQFSLDVVDEYGDAEMPMVGHLNLIQPNRIQVLGKTELRYLESLGKNSYHDTLSKLFEEKPAFVVVSDGAAATVDLKKRAEKTGISLLSSRLKSDKLIDHLSYYLTRLLAETKTLHGVFMEVRGLGVLLRGESGVGKSELALELLTRGHRLIADDAPEFSRIAPDVIRGACPELLQGFLEVRGLGVLNVRAMYGDSAIKKDKNLRLIIHLKPIDDEDVRNIDRLVGSQQDEMVLEVAIPCVTLPVAPGRDLALLIEAAVRNHILRLGGYDAAQDFIERQSGLLIRGEL